MGRHVGGQPERLRASAAVAVARGGWDGDSRPRQAVRGGQPLEAPSEPAVESGVRAAARDVARGLGEGRGTAGNRGGTRRLQVVNGNVDVEVLAGGDAVPPADLRGGVDGRDVRAAEAPAVGSVVAAAAPPAAGVGAAVVMAIAAASCIGEIINVASATVMTFCCAASVAISLAVPVAVVDARRPPAAAAEQASLCVATPDLRRHFAISTARTRKQVLKSGLS